MNEDFWNNKKVLITGHTGFKGSWLSILLNKLGAKVFGVSLKPNTEPNLYGLANIDKLVEGSFSDIRDFDSLQATVKSFNPEIIFHLAAQPLVRRSYADPMTTFTTNVMGTAHVLESIRTLPNCKVALVITTDKVYHNYEWNWPYRESDRLGGKDPYSASKAASELVVDSYRDAFLKEQGVAVATARAGNVIGGGDWSEDRLIPDAVRAWAKADTLLIRRPQAVRPWQHVLEPLFGYIKLAEAMWANPDVANAYNFGPHSGDSATVKQVIELAQIAYGKGTVEYATQLEGPHEAGLLALETAKVQQVLGLKPRWSIKQAVEKTMYWYAQIENGAQALDLCMRQIADYEKEVA